MFVLQLTHDYERQPIRYHVSGGFASDSPISPRVKKFHTGLEAFYYTERYKIQSVQIVEVVEAPVSVP